MSLQRQPVSERSQEWNRLAKKKHGKETVKWRLRQEDLKSKVQPEQLRELISKNKNRGGDIAQDGGIAQGKGPAFNPQKTEKNGQKHTHAVKSNREAEPAQGPHANIPELGRRATPCSCIPLILTVSSYCVRRLSDPLTEEEG